MPCTVPKVSNVCAISTISCMYACACKHSQTCYVKDSCSKSKCERAEIAGLELDQQEHFARPIRRSRRCNSFSDHLYDSADVHEAEENPCGLIVQQCEPEAEEATMYDAFATSYFPQSAEVRNLSNS